MLNAEWHNGFKHGNGNATRFAILKGLRKYDMLDEAVNSCI